MSGTAEAHYLAGDGDGLGRVPQAGGKAQVAAVRAEQRALARVHAVDKVPRADALQGRDQARVDARNVGDLPIVCSV